MSRFFNAVNKVDSHNKSRQYDLALEKWWVNQCYWLQLCTTAAMAMNITNCWKLFRYGVKIDHYDKLIGIRELSELLDQDCFNNTFSSDRGKPAKKIPPPPLMRSMMDIQFLLDVHLIFQLYLSLLSGQHYF